MDNKAAAYYVIRPDVRIIFVSLSKALMARGGNHTKLKRFWGSLCYSRSKFLGIVTLPNK